MTAPSGAVMLLRFVSIVHSCPLLVVREGQVMWHSCLSLVARVGQELAGFPRSGMPLQGGISVSGNDRLVTEVGRSVHPGISVTYRPVEIRLDENGGF